ncbi:2-keto-4-pentenoate hydratase/2-oxohepta-3-ene-1,7-dioic acid hydratase in catechol pathway [Catenuloplanes nepalensis]|uniref:2-keto-4-pentenoate hydratase/2-oxohepta-3-ene-1,7-dioic acid hydratase in catechol pathway n=1 Tax=Catenuloplanes nepalensis TaxID=587533 RepID=A0ABT9MNM1_9ACTN|nr:fumarylacetoacetate hydrolase family protein [Catenuloplanes nepalensis]MDP9793000.1 2-keto-4-pentenoate hydratase/2-oxohepta-3-ene-1,7-dioic acid hydratase in catechol pathway [Catenuloplanes nepalensis]
MSEILGSLALGTFASGSRAFAGLVRGDRVLELDAHAAALGLTAPITTRDLLADWDRVLPLLEALDGPTIGLSDLRVLPPVRPRQILQSGANYRTHVIDLAVAHRGPDDSEEQVRAATAAMMDARIANGTPYLFIGLPSAIAGPHDDLVLPGYSDRHDWELELAAVIGAPAYRVDRDRALRHVAAYTIVNDITTRDLVFRRDMPEIGTDWYRSKNAPGFLPLGPWLVPAAHVPDPMNLRVTLTLNGDVMQDESTKDMIFDVAAVVAAASQITPLHPGDLVLTGSPAGNGMHHGRLLRDGDVMTGAITGLGTQRVRCVAESAA